MNCQRLLSKKNQKKKQKKKKPNNNKRDNLYVMPDPSDCMARICYQSGANFSRPFQKGGIGIGIKLLVRSVT